MLREVLKSDVNQFRKTSFIGVYYYSDSCNDLKNNFSNHSLPYQVQNLEIT